MQKTHSYNRFVIESIIIDKYYEKKRINIGLINILTKIKEINENANIIASSEMF